MNVRSQIDPSAPRSTFAPEYIKADRSDIDSGNDESAFDDYREIERERGPRPTLSAYLAAIVLPWALSGAMDSAEGACMAIRHIRAEAKAKGVALTWRQCRDLLANPDRLKD